MIYYKNGHPHKVDKQKIIDYLSRYSWLDKDKAVIANEVCFRMDSIKVDSATVDIEETYTEAICQYILNNSIPALLQEADNNKIFAYLSN